MLVLVHQFRVQASSLRRRVVRASHVSLPEVKAIFLAKGSGERPDAAPARKRDFWRPDLVVGLQLVSAPALSFFRETVVAFGAYRAVPRPADL